jgi:serine/threonine-protein kinase
MDTPSHRFIGHVVLGRYRIVRPIGRGGMGVVFLARNEGAAGFVKPVVIKRTLAQDAATAAEIAKLSAREARIMSNLQHPGIVSVLDFAEESGSYLLVLDYVHGYNLAQWNRFLRQAGRPFSWEIACHVLASVLDALHYAHSLVGSDGVPLQVIHRDVSPANVLIDTGGHVKLADFGVARMLTDHTEDSSTLALKGKLSYMAPELLQHAEPSAASDLYACGVVLHELLIGSNEIRADSVVQTSTRVLWHILSPPSAARDDVPKELDAIVAKATAKQAHERFATAQEFAQALRGLQTKSPEAVAGLLTAAVARDFHDPEMAKELNVDALATLDRAWRLFPTEDAKQAEKKAEDRRGRQNETTLPLDDSDAGSMASVPILITPMPPAVAVEPTSPVPPPAPAPARHRLASWPMFLGAMGVASLVAAIALLGVRRSQNVPADNRLIVVESQSVPSGPPRVEPILEAREGDGVDRGGTEISAQTPEAPADPVIAGPAAGVHSRTKGTQNSRAEGIARAFARQKGQVAQCFTANQADPVSAEMAVRFDVDTKGKVVSARILPSSVAATPLGACIARVALSTDFGPQPEPLSFRVPISARRLP